MCHRRLVFNEVRYVDRRVRRHCSGIISGSHEEVQDIRCRVGIFVVFHARPRSLLAGTLGPKIFLTLVER